MHSSNSRAVHFAPPAGGLLNAQGAQGRPLHTSPAKFLCIFLSCCYFETTRGVARRRGIGATAICASFPQNAAAVTPLSQPGASASLLHTFPGVLRAPTCHTPSVPISSRSSPHCSSCVREPTTQTEAAFPISSSASAKAASSRSVVCRVSRRKRQRSAWVIPRQ